MILKLILSIYYLYILLWKTNQMKTLSLKLDEDIYQEADRITAKMNIARNRYINEAVRIYNIVNNRRLIKNQLSKEAILVSADSMKILSEFERFIDED